jgi:acetoin utilization deacetylase AcuC-like enzyme
MVGLDGLWKSFFGKKFPFKFICRNEYWRFATGRHVFPVQKYRLVYEQLLAMGARREHFLRPRPASDKDVLRVHTARYLDKLTTGTLSPADLRRLEIRFSPELVRFAYLSVGGTILAARKAVEDGLAVHVGGGFHHAFPGHGEGFCVFNDVAVAVETLRAEKAVGKAMVVDCDVHQGNGTAAIFRGRPDVFTFSIHQADLYPEDKPPSTLDVELASGDGDEEYLAALGSHIPKVFREFRPDLLVYLAGADPYEKDQLGGLGLTKSGLKKRDSLVIGGARRLGIPVAVVLAGGYAVDVEDVVDIHVNTIKVARRTQRSVFGRRPGRSSRSEPS